MKQSNFFKFLLLTILVTGIPSCQDDCSDLDGPYYYDARIIGFQVVRIDKQVTPREWQRYRSDDTVNANGDVMIFLQSFNEELAFHKTTIRGGLFTNSVYACSPIYKPRTDQKFVGLTITSTEDYDANHPAGSDLIDLFVTEGEQDGVNDQRIPLSQHLGTNSDDFIIRPPNLFLNKSPDNLSAHAFRFELELSDTTFNFQTKEIILK